MPLQLDDTFDPTATIRDCLAAIYDNIRAIALAQNGVVNYKDNNCEDADPKISVRKDANQW